MPLTMAGDLQFNFVVRMARADRRLFGVIEVTGKLWASRQIFQFCAPGGRMK
jgi:hypothetical protein